MDHKAMDQEVLKSIPNLGIAHIYRNTAVKADVVPVAVMVNDMVEILEGDRVDRKDNDLTNPRGFKTTTVIEVVVGLANVISSNHMYPLYRSP